MDFLRRSIHGGKDHPHMPHISTPIPAVSKPTPAIQPPKKVIRALDDHRPQAPHELSFQKGDFFYVVNEIDQGSDWYEANNPMTGARGLVPKSKFEVFNRSNAAFRTSQAAVRSASKFPGIMSPPNAARRRPVYYAVVQHNFVSERADELDAKAGDHISVVAQSNFEWFVAKPISRLGRPGLIPVSFVAVHEPTSGRMMTEDEVKVLMQHGDIPNVEEWKKSILEYKATSISLGTLDDDNSRGMVTNSPYAPYSQGPPKLEAIPEPEPQVSMTPIPSLSHGIILSGEVLSWHFEMDEYWFRIHALFQPDGDPDTGQLPPAKQLVLFRMYNDFYDFQVNLLDIFPLEAGRIPAASGREPKRILPFMPGPSQHVDDKITQLRKDELDQYLCQLCGLWELGAEYILRHRIVLDFFTPRAGDVEEEVEPAYRILEERATPRQYAADQDATEQMRKSFLRLNVDETGNRDSDGSNYDDREYASSSKSAREVVTADRSFATSPTSEHSRYRAAGQQESSYSPYSANHKYSESTASALSKSVSSRNESNEGDYGSAANNGLRNADVDGPHSYASQPPSAAPSASSGKSRSRSASNALNSPPISANNPNTAFIKIKIFDRLTQDLIAIRVSPRVTHEQLMDKVRLRLGDDVQHLAYRNSITNTFVGLDDDHSLKEWLERTDKHTLYAD